MKPKQGNKQSVSAEYMPLVSIIMNCYNGERYLREAINSIYEQTYENWEIIFWDNASVDNSALIAESYDKRLRYFLAEETTPLGEARSLAIKEAKGGYIAFLDCDDIYFPNKIEIQLRKMQDNNAILSFGSWIKIDGNGHELNKYKIKEFYGNQLKNLLRKYTVNFQTLMINRQFMKENDMTFNDKLKFAPDFDLVMRIAYNFNVMSIADYLVKYRVHNNSMSKKYQKDKFNDFDNTIDLLKGLGAESKLPNLNQIVLFTRYRMQLRDCLDNRDYKGSLSFTLQYLLALIFPSKR